MGGGGGLLSMAGSTLGSIMNRFFFDKVGFVKTALAFTRSRRVDSKARSTSRRLLTTRHVQTVGSCEQIAYSFCSFLPHDY